MHHCHWIIFTVLLLKPHRCYTYTLRPVTLKGEHEVTYYDSRKYQKDLLGLLIIINTIDNIAIAYLII